MSCSHEATNEMHKRLHGVDSKYVLTLDRQIKFLDDKRRNLHHCYIYMGYNTDPADNLPLTVEINSRFRFGSKLTG